MTTAHQSDFDAHHKAIDDLHAKLASSPGVDKEKLHTAVAKYKGAFAQFMEDAQGCLHPG